MGYKTSSLTIASNKSSSLSASNGGCPAIISYISTPSAHQSTLLVYGRSSTIYVRGESRHLQGRAMLKISIREYNEKVVQY